MSVSIKQKSTFRKQTQKKVISWGCLNVEACAFMTCCEMASGGLSFSVHIFWQPVCHSSICAAVHRAKLWTGFHSRGEKPCIKRLMAPKQANITSVGQGYFWCQKKPTWRLMGSVMCCVLLFVLMHIVGSVGHGITEWRLPSNRKQSEG